MDFINYNKYENIPKYTGKDTFYVTSMFSRITGIAVPIAFAIFYLILGVAIWNSTARELVYIPLQIGIAIIIFMLCLVAGRYKKVKVSEEGISLINVFGNSIKHFEWDNIEQIHVLIGISTLESNYKFFVSTNPFKIFGLNWRYTASSPEYMVIKYNPQIIHCILQYWDGDIDNYDDPKSWQRYIARIQEMKGKE